MKFLEVLLVLLPLLAQLFDCHKIGELNQIDYDTQIATNEQEFFKNKHIVLVFCESNKKNLFI
jgi:hypothetical protein